MAQHEQRRHAAFQVVLADERFEYAHVARKGRAGVAAFVGRERDGIFHMLRKVRPIAQVAPAAHHRQVHAGAPALKPGGKDVGVLGDHAGVVLDRLLVQDARQCRELIADFGRLLETECLRVRHHLRPQGIDQLLLLALEKALGVRDVAGIVGRLDEADARARATLDLVQQAGPRAVREHRVLAGPKVEDLLQQLDRFLHRPGARKRPEVTMALVDGAAVVGDSRKARRRGHAGRAGGRHARAGDLQVRIALVVAEQDVVAREQRLDQVVFEQQRFRFGAHDRRLHVRDLRHHLADPHEARAGVALLEIAGDALLQLARLADIEHGPVGIEIAVHAGQVRQRGDVGQQLLAQRVLLLRRRRPWRQRIVMGRFVGHPMKIVPRGRKIESGGRSLR